MKKFIFTSLLTIASSLWAFCNASVQLPSLCDEWHIDVEPFVPDRETIHLTQRLTTDTIIGGLQYRQLRGEQYMQSNISGNDDYLGALREGLNADIYFVPAGSSHEYLLYAFNAAAGDTLKNVWLGGTPETYPNGCVVIVKGSQPYSHYPNSVDVDFISPDGYEGQTCWINEVGWPSGPIGWAELPNPLTCTAPELTCAYKLGSCRYKGRNSNCIDEPLRLQFLCDTWNVLIDPSSYGCNQYRISVKRLATDVIINSKRYVRLEENNAYWGALREDENANIYFVPNDGSNHEYLLYAFGAQVGDQLTNLWLGENCPDCYEYTATVTSISENNPRVFTIDINFTSGYVGTGPLQAQWIEGVGYASGPTDAPMTPLPTEIDLCAFGLTTVLCAYKDGEQVYTSELSNEFGCTFDGTLPVTQATQWYGVQYEAYPYRPGFTEPRLSDANFSLQGDTVISSKTYSRLCGGNGNYIGAIRFSPSGRQAYYVPIYNENWSYFLEDGVFEEGAEYLLYDLNVSVGDTVKAFSSTVNLSCDMAALDDWTVLNVRTIDGRIHARVKSNYSYWEVEWIEGIGTPYIVWSGQRDCQPTDGSTVRPYTLCAADSDGNILYSFNLENIGVRNECPYWSRIGDESASDTIPLYRYTGDDPGSSTVDPVDPNQVVVILQGDELTIREFSGDEIGYTLTNMHTANAPARNRSAQADTFRNSVSVQLTEDGRYTLNLTNPEWGYNIYGTFDYGRDAFVPVTSETVATKILLNGRPLIRQSDHLYTPTGIQIE